MKVGSVLVSVSDSQNGFLVFLISSLSFLSVGYTEIMQFHSYKVPFLKEKNIKSF